jgi:hypothetical protein
VQDAAASDGLCPGEESLVVEGGGAWTALGCGPDTGAAPWAALTDANTIGVA